MTEADDHKGKYGSKTAAHEGSRTLLI